MYEDTVESDDRAEGQQAMNEEVKSLDENNTYTLTELPEGKSLVGTRLTYTVKKGHNGKLSHKAHFVAKGSS